MLIFLPPSEGKVAPSRGPTLDLAELSHPGLFDSREEICEALIALSATPGAAKILGLGKRSAGDLPANMELFSSHCALAEQLFEGVLFAELDSSSLSTEGRAKYFQQTWIFSALFGVLQPGDLIPNHRLKIETSLPPLGSLASWWRPRLEGDLPDVTGNVVVDLRSSSYRRMFPADGTNRIEVGAVVIKDGGRKTVSHMAKLWRGRVARHLLNDPDLGDFPSTAQIAESVRRAGRNHKIVDVEVTDPSPKRGDGTLTTITLVLPGT